MAVIESIVNAKDIPIQASKTAPSPDLRSRLEQFLSKPSTAIFATILFCAILLVWTQLDHSYPVHDAAWHSSFSNAVKQWLCRPKGWSMSTLSALLTMQPNYPAGMWFFNGVCKIFLGDSHFSEHLILAIHLCILNLSTYLLTNLLLKDRMKSLLTLLFLDCSPLILTLQHISYIDLPHTAFFAAFLFSAVWWWQDRNWGRTGVCALFFAIDCVSKQIAVLYSVPILAVFALILLYSKQYKDLFKVAAIGAAGAGLLSTWVLPNLHSLTTYTHNRSSLASDRIGFFAGVVRNLKIAGPEIFQGFSPLMTLMLIFTARKIGKTDLALMWPALFAPIAGAILMLCVAFFNIPETRYFGPLILPLAMLLAVAASALIRESGNGCKLVAVSIVLCLAQVLLLCFQKCPVVADQTVNDTRMPYVALGITDPQLSLKLSYEPAGDPWKQQWMFNFIEKIEQGRPVYLNVLGNSPEFNQGTLLCISRMRHSYVYPTTWRCSMADVSDSFAYTDNELHFMQWLAVNTGKNNCRWYDAASQKNYSEVLSKLSQSGQYIEAAREPLPDGSELILYQNKFWMWNRTVPPLVKKQDDVSS